MNIKHTDDELKYEVNKLLEKLGEKRNMGIKLYVGSSLIRGKQNERFK